MQKELKKIKIVNNKINFVCLQKECPNSCCGPFGGVQRGIDSVEGRNFSEIVLTSEDSNSLISSGYSYLIELTDTGYYRMNLLDDGTCTALTNGICTIHRIKPTLCRAFPFYVDMFVGLCAITECPGFGVGWTKIESLKSEIEAAKTMYLYWLSTIETAR